MINNPTYLNPSSRCWFPNGLITSTAFLSLGFSLPKQNGVPCPLGRPSSGWGFQGILYRPSFSYYLKIQQHFLKDWYITYIRFEDYLTATYFIFFPMAIFSCHTAIFPLAVRPVVLILDESSVIPELLQDQLLAPEWQLPLHHKSGFCLYGSL